ncbi:Fmt Methionyl-tRNA formyltransferase [Candidatus Nanopelagicaceae bacterium]
MRKVYLFINGQLGLDILQFLIQERDTEISAIVINGPGKVKSNYFSIVQEILTEKEKEIKLFQYSDELWQDLLFNQELSPATFGISVLFGHLFPQDLIQKFNGKLINLHPSLLPIGRGADPIFWSIVDGLPQGATIHRVAKTIDSGEIYTQEEVELSSWLNAGQIYELCMAKLYELFIEFYPGWDHSTPSAAQIGKGTYHEARDLLRIKSELLETPGNLFYQLNMVQALTYNDGRKANLVLPNGEIWEVSLQLKRIQE